MNMHGAMDAESKLLQAGKRHKNFHNYRLHEYNIKRVMPSTEANKGLKANHGNKKQVYSPFKNF
jgi:hypothetical protein